MMIIRSIIKCAHVHIPTRNLVIAMGIALVSQASASTERKLMTALEAIDCLEEAFADITDKDGCIREDSFKELMVEITLPSEEDPEGARFSKVYDLYKSDGKFKYAMVIEKLKSAVEEHDKACNDNEAWNSHGIFDHFFGVTTNQFPSNSSTNSADHEKNADNASHPVSDDQDELAFHAFREWKVLSHNMLANGFWKAAHDLRTKQQNSNRILKRLRKLSTSRGIQVSRYVRIVQKYADEVKRYDQLVRKYAEEVKRWKRARYVCNEGERNWLEFNETKVAEFNKLEQEYYTYQFFKDNNYYADGDFPSAAEDIILLYNKYKDVITATLLEAQKQGT